MVLQPFRAIVEFSAYDGRHYHTLQIGRPYLSEPEKELGSLIAGQDYLAYIFNRFPLDGFFITGLEFDQLMPLANHIQHSNGNLDRLHREHKQTTLSFDQFLSEEPVDLTNCTLPQKQYPAYEPFFPVIEVESPDPEIEAHGYATKLELCRILEYIALLQSLGYAESQDGDWLDQQVIQWSERNAKVFRLANPSSDSEGNPLLNIADIKFCPPGNHYWHIVHGKFVRKFYSLGETIASPKVKQAIDSIPKEPCPDSLEHRVDREG